MFKISSWKMMWGCIAAYLIIILASLVFTSCGARKVFTDTASSASDSAASKQAYSYNYGNISNASNTAVTAGSMDLVNKVKEAARTTETKIYDPATGNLTKVTTRTENHKSSDNSIKKKSLALEITNRIDSVFNSTHYRLVTITTHKEDSSKLKQSNSNNNALYWTIFGVLVLLVIIYFAYRYFTRKI